MKHMSPIAPPRQLEPAGGDGVCFFILIRCGQDWLELKKYPLKLDNYGIEIAEKNFE